jgi:hypothetical protein
MYLIKYREIHSVSATVEDERFYFQIKRYDDRKRRFPVVYSDGYVGIHYNYDRIRAVGHPFGSDRITAINRRGYMA